VDGEGALVKTMEDDRHPQDVHGKVTGGDSASSGTTLQLFKGHMAPVTALELYKSDGKTYLISGSWDKVGHKSSQIW
jgi:hypothetical protein